jgi:hypothetical protein
VERGVHLSSPGGRVSYQLEKSSRRVVCGGMAEGTKVEVDESDLRSAVSRRPNPGLQIMISPRSRQLTRVERDSIVLT